MIRFVRQMLETAFALVTFVLLAEFVLRILSPGDADTAGIFRMLQPFRIFLEPAINVLLAPIRLLLAYVGHWIPPAFASWFPVMPADTFFQQLGRLALQFPGLPETSLGRDVRNAPYAVIFPGVVDWRPLMAVFFWGLSESLARGLFFRLDAFLYRRSLRRRDALFFRPEETLPPATG